MINCENLRGYYNRADADIEACHVCEPGYFCPYGYDDHFACPAGTWSLGAAEFCHECPAGYECPHTEIPAMNMCLTGWYSAAGQHECTVCEAGYECVGDHHEPCPADQWSLTGEGVCKYLLAGWASWDSATEVSTACADGEYSLYGTGDCKSCPVAHKCPTVDKAPIVCEPGTYQDEVGQQSCKSCSSGQYSLFHSTECYDCPAGY